MASNRVTPSPEGEKYPLEQYTLDREPTKEQLYHPEHFDSHQEPYQGQQDKKELIIGDEEDDNLKDGALAIQTGEEHTPDSKDSSDTGYQGDQEVKDENGSRSSVNDVNNIDHREMHSPSPQKDDTVDQTVTQYSPPPKDPKEHSPRRLGEQPPDSRDSPDTGYQGDKEVNDENRSRSSVNDISNIEDREMHSPSPRKDDTVDQTVMQYSPPPKDPEDSHRRLPPVGISNEQLKSRYPADEDNHEKETNINLAALPPISGGGNKVVPASEETVQRSELRQRSAGYHGNTQGQQSSLVWKGQKESKKDIIYGAEDNTEGAGCCGWLLWIFSVLLIIITLPFSLVLTIKVVQEYERAVIFRLGRLPQGGAKGPGIFFIIPCIESYTKVDLRTVSFDVPPQEVLTKDSVTVSVDAVVYYRVNNPTISVANVENAHHSTRLLAQTTLRNILGTKNMSEILSDRESISSGMQSTLDEATDRWGIRVERVEIKDVRLPVQLQRAMAAEAEAAREARAKVIAAEGEHKASHSLKEAADIMAQSSASLQLRYLQTLNTISAEKNSTIIFPLPIDLIKGFMGHQGGRSTNIT